MAAVVSAALAPGLAPAGVFNPAYTKLANGLEVVVIENRRVPAVIQMLWYKVGATDEAPGESGAAHFFEHLMFKGTEKHPPDEFSAFVRRHGGFENAFTSPDQTGYYQVVQKDQLEQIMAFEADRMTGLTLTQEQIESERAVVLEEWNERVGASPAAQLGAAMYSAMFRNHNYGRPIIGWRHEILELDRETLLAFYRRYYAPDNAVLVIAGDVDSEAAFALAEKHYGNIPASNNPPAKWTREPPSRAPRTVTLTDERVSDPSWRRMYLAPSDNTEGREHVLALDILSDILGDRSVGRLARNIVRKDRIALAAGAYYNGSRRGPATFSFYATPHADQTLEAVEAAIEAEIANVLENGVTEEEVEATKKRMLSAAVFARDDLETGARIFGRTLANGGTIDDVEKWPEMLAEVTADDVKRAAALVFKPERSVTGLLLPKETTQ